MLKFPNFVASKQIQAVAKNHLSLKKGSKGYGVSLVQGALIDLGYSLPLSMKKGSPDGLYGKETAKGVSKFQKDKKLKEDGIVGQKTIKKIDFLMAEKPSLKHLSSSKSLFSSLKSRDYKIGTDDPKINSDRGSGTWKSAEITITALAQKTAILNALPAAGMHIGSDAAKHLRHYFRNIGTKLTIDLVSMVNDVPSAKAFYELEVYQAKKFVEQLPLGVYSITSKKIFPNYNKKNENKNWYYAVGGYSLWGKGKASVEKKGTGKVYTLDFEYKIFDRYNWDKGKEVVIKIPGVDEEITITDEFMGDFHRQGLAKEYDLVGSFKKIISWKGGEAISSAQMKPKKAETGR